MPRAFAMDVVTLSSFILDDIYQYPPVLQPLHAIAGGAGLYAAIAARMFSPGDASTGVGFVLHKGRDFPKSVEKQFEALDMHAKFVDRLESNTTRGSNVYDVDGNRKFVFVTPNLKIYASMMDEKMLTSKTYHIFCTPSRCIDLCLEIFEARKQLQREQPKLDIHLSRRPMIVWEPMEDCCRSSEREAFMKAIELVDVFSPNLRELMALEDVDETAGLDLNIQTVAQACKKLLEGTQERAIIARCGRHGCIIVCSRCRHYLAVPAYHESLTVSTVSGRSEMVVDPTGGGNAFLGGFCKALSSESAVGNLTGYEAATIYGSVAASYAIEQFGAPQMRMSECGEMWNGSDPFLRLAELSQRLEERPGVNCGLRALI